MEFIKDLKNLSKYNTIIAGGKGASLGEMIKAGISVPPGFVILSTAFEKFLEETDLNIEIDSILDSVNHKEMHTIEDASERIKALILQTEMPKDISNEIQKFFKKLDSKYVAIRSSATVEDSSVAAWAGQLESYLNTTEENLLESVKKCWASLFTPRAIFYRFEKKLRKQKISVAVVVQKMVNSEKSGIAFSVHPVTQDMNQLIVEASFGLGEAIVSGQITPDSYVIKKQPRRIIDKNIQTQSRGLYRSENGGNEWRDIPKKQGKKQILSDKEILKLSEIILRIENHFGCPCDIEWAKRKKIFYITQSRPITTISDISANNQDVFDYIKSQRWFFGIRTDESLLFYSAKTGGYKYIKQEYGISFAETLLIPFRKNYPIRVFNLWQAKNFHAISNEKILKNPEILSSYVEKDDIVYQKINVQGEKLLSVIKEGDYDKSVRLFNEIFSLYEIASAYFFIIFSLGLKLAENINNLNDVKDVVKKHDAWRNGVAFKEEAMGGILLQFFKYFLTKKKLKLDSLLLMKFLTINEIKLWLKEKLTDTEIENKIKSRKKHGFVYLNLKDKSLEIIDNVAEIKKIQTYFLKLDKESKKTKNSDEITGQVVYNSKKPINGKAIIIKDKFGLKSKNHLINGNILVAVQTTPHFIPYMKKAKAIITDEGGLTCHAAIIAREFRIPCIVATKIATQVLKDGDIIEVDANTGIIKILK